MNRLEEEARLKEIARLENETMVVSLKSEKAVKTGKGGDRVQVKAQSVLLEAEAATQDLAQNDERSEEDGSSRDQEEEDESTKEDEEKDEYNVDDSVMMSPASLKSLGEFSVGDSLAPTPVKESETSTETSGASWWGIGPKPVDSNDKEISIAQSLRRSHSASPPRVLRLDSDGVEIVADDDNSSGEIEGSDSPSQRSSGSSEQRDDDEDEDEDEDE
mmetsp:Transcript_13559/g.27726  ORF Transcript_13559/g.27726 Transcript_13559/m.27726 type:complete len:217 (-) Transcript_13559:4-654(-)